MDLYWVAKTRILREMVHDEVNITIGDKACSSATSPCYFDAPGDQNNEFVSLCMPLTNMAPIGNVIDQCEYRTPDYMTGIVPFAFF